MKLSKKEPRQNKLPKCVISVVDSLQLSIILANRLNKGLKKIMYYMQLKNLHRIQNSNHKKEAKIKEILKLHKISIKKEFLSKKKFKDTLQLELNFIY